MTRDDIIRMAREAGLVRAGNNWTEPARWGMTELERFAELVAAAEREACAKVCSDRAMHCESEAQRAISNGEHDEVSAIRSTAWQISVCAADIRSRSKP